MTVKCTECKRMEERTDGQGVTTQKCKVDVDGKPSYDLCSNRNAMGSCGYFEKKGGIVKKAFGWVLSRGPISRCDLCRYIRWHYSTIGGFKLMCALPLLDKTISNQPCYDRNRDGKCIYYKRRWYLFWCR